MENTTSNRLSSAKWSRNLNEDSQAEANRLRLLERQRQLLETKLQRRQNQTTTSGVVASRPATSNVASSRARVSRQTSSENILDSTSLELAAIKNIDHHVQASSTNTNRARTSIGDSRKPANYVEALALSSTSLVHSNNNNNNNAIRSQTPPSKQRVDVSVKPTNTNNTTTNRAEPSTSRISNIRSLSKSEVNLRDALNVDEKTMISKQKTPSTTTTTTTSLHPNPLTTILTDEQLLNFVSQPISPDVTLQCTIIRDKKGLDRSFYPTYYMHLQDIIINSTSSSIEVSTTTTTTTATTTIDSKINSGLEGTATISMSGSIDSLESIKSNEDNEFSKNESKKNNEGTTTTTDDNGGTMTNGAKSGHKTNNNSNRKVFVLSGRRRKKSKTYLIGNNAFDISRDRCLAKLKSNVLGTQFIAIRLQANGVRYEIASISYETNVLGFKGPRKMNIIIPKPDEKTNVLCNLSLQEELKRNSRAIMLLKNKTPIWNEETQSYVLNFHGRVTQASVKNFQLVVYDPSAAVVASRRYKTGSGATQNDIRRSLSSHQLQQQRYGDEMDIDGIGINDRDEDDDEEDEDDNNDDDDDDDDSEVDNNKANNNNRNKNNNQHRLVSTRPLSKSLNKSGYPLASSSEDAKLLAADQKDLVSLQFGRVSNTQFSCDVSWPLSLLQAFAIALSSFDSKLACE